MDFGALRLIWPSAALRARLFQLIPFLGHSVTLGDFVTDVIFLKRLILIEDYTLLDWCRSVCLKSRLDLFSRRLVLLFRVNIDITMFCVDCSDSAS